MLFLSYAYKKKLKMGDQPTEAHISNWFTKKHDGYVGSTGHKNNFTGRAGADGWIGSMAGAQADWESQAFARQHTPYPGSGSFGITHMRPCNANGKPLTEEQSKQYRLSYDASIRWEPTEKSRSAIPPLLSQPSVRD